MFYLLLHHSAQLGMAQRGVTYSMQRASVSICGRVAPAGLLASASQGSCHAHSHCLSSTSGQNMHSCLGAVHIAEWHAILIHDCVIGSF
jgi:hypothetical protein